MIAGTRPARWAWILAVVLCLSTWVLLGAEETVEVEDQVKAVFIYNFLKFVRWPDSDTLEAYTVVVVGKSKVTVALREIAAKQSIRGKPILIRQIQSADEIDRCHILFVPSQQQDSLAEILEGARQKNVLTVGESAGLAARGVGINLVRVSGKIRLEVNKHVTDREGLRLSPQLLTVATIVDQAEDQGDQP